MFVGGVVKQESPSLPKAIFLFNSEDAPTMQARFRGSLQGYDGGWFAQGRAFSQSAFKWRKAKSSPRGACGRGASLRGPSLRHGQARMLLAVLSG